jgi:hypothetical protein
VSFLGTVALTIALLGSLSGPAWAHAPACFPERTIVARATLYDSNGAPVGNALGGQVVYVVDESESEELAEVEIRVFGGLRVRVERALLTGFARAEIPLDKSAKGQSWWGQNAPLLIETGDARSAVVAPHPKARTPEMEGINFVPRKLSCAGVSGVPLAPLKTKGCSECAVETVPVPDPGPAVWWWWDQRDQAVFPGVAATSTFLRVTKTDKPLMTGHLVGAAIPSASSRPDDGSQDSYALVETLWGPLRRRDLIARSRLLFEEPKQELLGRGSGDLCGYYKFDQPGLSDASIALTASPAPFRFFAKGKDVLTLPTGTKVHVAPGSEMRDLIGFHWPSDENPMLTLTGWIPSGQLTERRRPPSHEEKKDLAPEVPSRRHRRTKAN